MIANQALTHCPFYFKVPLLTASWVPCGFGRVWVKREAGARDQNPSRKAGAAPATVSESRTINKPLRNTREGDGLDAAMALLASPDTGPSRIISGIAEGGPGKHGSRLGKPP